MIRQLKVIPMITPRDNQSIERYLQAIKEIPRITAEEEVSLAQRIHKGDRDAFDSLVYANLRFVVSVAKKYQNLGLTFADLISEGNVGLCKAAGRYDETKGFKFISYAVWWIRQTILNALSGDGKMVALPMNVINATRKVRDMGTMLLAINGHEPTPEDIAESLDMSVKEVLDAMANEHDRHFSLDAIANDHGEDSVTYLDLLKGDLEPTDHDVEHESRSERIVSALKEFLRTPREYQIVAYYYGIDGYEQLKLEQISSRIGTTRERTRQIFKEAKRRIQGSARMKKLMYA